VNDRRNNRRSVCFIERSSRPSLLAQWNTRPWNVVSSSSLMRTDETVSRARAREVFANNTFRRVAEAPQTFQAPLSYPVRGRPAILSGLKNFSVLNLRVLRNASLRGIQVLYLRMGILQVAQAIRLPTGDLVSRDARGRNVKRP